MLVGDTWAMVGTARTSWLHETSKSSYVSCLNVMVGRT